MPADSDNATANGAIMPTDPNNATANGGGGYGGGYPQQQHQGYGGYPQQQGYGGGYPPQQGYGYGPQPGYGMQPSYGHHPQPYYGGHPGGGYPPQQGRGLFAWECAVVDLTNKDAFLRDYQKLMVMVKNQSQLFRQLAREMEETERAKTITNSFLVVLKAATDGLVELTRWRARIEPAIRYGSLIGCSKALSEIDEVIRKYVWARQGLEKQMSRSITVNPNINYVG